MSCDSLALLVKGPAADLRIAGWVHIEALAPGPGISLQFQQRLHCLVIPLHSKATHQVGRPRWNIPLTAAHAIRPSRTSCGSVVVEFTGPEHLCGQCRPLDLRGDGIPVAQQLPEVGELRVLHIRQPLDVLNQVSLLLCDLFRRPGQSSISLLLSICISSTIPHSPRVSHSRGRCISDSYFLTPFQKIKNALRRTATRTG